MAAHGWARDTMAGKRPTGAMVLSAIGGLFILMGGIALIFIGAFIAALLGAMMPIPLGTDPDAMIYMLGALGVGLGLGIMALGIVMFIKPKLSKIFGIVIVVLSIASIIAAGGFFLGLTLGVVGGILGLLFKAQPETAPQYAAAPPSA